MEGSADVTSSVLRFLPLRDAVSYGSTSRRGLVDLAADMHRRRRRMLPYYRWTYANEKYPKSGASWSTSKFRMYPVDKKDIAADGSGGHLLMSTVDRLQILLRAKSFVTSHPLYARVRELHGLLKEEEGCDDENINVEMTTGNNEEEGHDQSFESSLLELRRASRAHSLHAEILTVAIRPELSSAASVPSHCSPGSVTVPLVRYVGDVLVAYYFMSHIVSGLCEGGPTEEAWMHETLTNVSERRATASSWYRAWIFLHSAVLRTAPFLPEHTALLGIEPRSLIQDDDCGNSGATHRAELVTDALGLPPLFPPPPPFVGADKRIMMSRLSQLHDDAPVKITKNALGHLGPAFRGRDNVSSETVWPMRAISVVVAFFGLPPSAYHSPTNPALLRWREGTEAGIRWLLDLHTEAGKIHPMTVTPPFITITTKA